MLWGRNFEISEQIHEIWKNLFNKILDDLIEKSVCKFQYHKQPRVPISTQRF